MSVQAMCYESQFFEFTPQTCILRVYITFQDYLFEMALVVEKVIMKKLESMQGNKISHFQIRESTEKYLNFMRERFNFLFQKMETFLLNLVLSIPKNVLLLEDKVHSQYSYTKEEFEHLQTETEALQKKCKAESLATQRLLAELEEQKHVQAELEKILTWFKGLDKICREHGNIHLKESFGFMTQTTRKLQDTVKEIDTKHKKIKVGGSALTPSCPRIRKIK
ncbi:protein MIS12 homolog [Xenopus laevis]|uniref:Protein MIS12 homolog n=2 Tax=Xenopus laevis TaxID=8355 RepID=A0A974DKA8_XENLA|nr:protein MIS12 homolog [Xenopus laevis]OCT92346.1 hypothetical protein XELAEV_18015403mg [Xenopus laevis]